MKVVLAIDASRGSQSLVEAATSRPWPSGTRFIVLHVVNMAALGRFAVMLDQEKKAGQTLVAVTAEKLACAGLDAGTDVLVGFPRKAITEYAKEWGADFIFVASHGQSAVARFLLGSVAQAVLRTAPCSVEVVRSRLNGAWAKGNALKILLATDGSECATAAVRSVMSRPWPSGSQTKIISVAELVIPGSEVIASSSSPTYPISLLEQMWNDARERARDAVEQARKLLETAEMKTLQEESALEGDPRFLLLEQAREWGADLIVLGSHGRRAIDRVLMGSVSEFVALHAQCSVEVIRG